MCNMNFITGNGMIPEQWQLLHFVKFSLLHFVLMYIGCFWSWCKLSAVARCVQRTQGPVIFVSIKHHSK